MTQGADSLRVAARMRTLLWAGLFLGATGATTATGQEVREAVDVGGLEARSAALVWSGQQGGKLPMAALALPWPVAGSESGDGEPESTDRVPVLLVVEIDGRWLLDRLAAVADGESEDPVVEVHAYGLGPDESLQAHFTQAFVLEREWGQATDWRGVRFVGALDLPPGPSSVRLLVRQRLRPGGQAGARPDEALALRVLPVTVPAREPAEPWVSPPFMVETVRAPGPGRWMIIQQGGRQGKPWLLEWPSEWRREEGGRFFGPPTARPALRAPEIDLFALAWGSEASLRALELKADSFGLVISETTKIRGWDLLGSDLGSDPSGLGERSAEKKIRDAETTDFTRLRRERENLPASTEITAWHLLRLAVRVEEPGSPRAVQLAIRLPSQAGDSSTGPVPASPVLLLPNASPNLAWTDLDSEGSMETAPSPREAPPPPSPETGEALREDHRYRRALALWAAGRDTRALEAVRELERSWLSNGGSFEDLARHQLALAAELVGREANRLLPLFDLHRRLYSHHRRHGEYGFAAHDRRMALALMELYGRLESSPAAEGVAALALVDLAGEMVDLGERLSALELLERALVLDPDHPEALLLAGALHELLGQGDRAVALLKRLEGLEPGLWEARLRLAVNQLRQGSGKAGEERLRACLTPQAPPWIRALAIQELAARAMEEQRWAEAEALLRDGLAELPRVQRLYLQLSAVLEAQGRHEEALEAVRTLETVARRSGGGSEESPRLRYGHLPAERLAINRERWQAHVEAGREELQTALGLVDSGDGAPAASSRTEGP